MFPTFEHNKKKYLKSHEFRFIFNLLIEIK